MIREEEVKVIVKLAAIPISEREIVICNTIHNLPLDEAVKLEICFRRLFAILDEEERVMKLN